MASRSRQGRMMTELAMTAPIRALQRLRATDFGGLPIVDSLGQLDALFLFRAHREVIDCVLVRGGTEAIASGYMTSTIRLIPFGRRPTRCCGPTWVIWSSPSASCWSCPRRVSAASRASLAEDPPHYGPHIRTFTDSGLHAHQPG